MASASSTTAGSSPAGSAGTVPHRGIITIAAMIATLMQALDSTIANVALPYMQGSLSATADQVTWVLTSYVVSAAIMTAPVGWFAARFGRKRLFVVCLAGFTIASVLCGVAQSLDEMVLFRLLQGAFGAALVPLSQATMLDIYPPEQRGSAMAIWGMGVMVGPILGPTLGGWLTDAYNWRWVFFINVPFGVLAILGLLGFLPESKTDRELRFDWIGFAALSLGLGAAQMMLDRGQQKGWFGSTEIIVETVLGGLGLYLFIVHMSLAPKPFISPRIFKDRNFLSGFLMMFAIGMVLLASSALLAPYVQTLGGYPVATAGLLMAPRGLGTMIAMMIAGRLASRMDPRLIMLAGIIGISGSLWEMTLWTPDVDAWHLAGTTILQGFGLGLVFIPLQVIAFATLPTEQRTEGTALMSLIRNVGSAIGISITSVLRESGTQTMHEQLAAFATPFNRILQWGGAARYWDLHTTAGAALLDETINRQASIIAYGNDFMFMMIVTLPTVLLLFLMRRPNAAAKPDPHAAVMD